MGTVNCVNDGRETGFGQDGIDGTASSVGGTLDSSAGVGAGQGGGVVGVTDKIVGMEMGILLIKRTRMSRRTKIPMVTRKKKLIWAKIFCK